MLLRFNVSQRSLDDRVPGTATTWLAPAFPHAHREFALGVHDVAGPYMASTRNDIAMPRRTPFRLHCDIAGPHCVIATGQCDMTERLCDIATGRCDMTKRRCDIAMRHCDMAMGRCGMNVAHCDIAQLYCDMATRHCSIAMGRCDVTKPHCDVSMRHCDMTKRLCDKKKWRVWVIRRRRMLPTRGRRAVSWRMREAIASCRVPPRAAAHPRDGASWTTEAHEFGHESR